MGGGGSSSLSFAMAASVPRLSPHELDMIGGRTVGDILDEAERSGAIVFEKPREDLRTDDKGSRDLFAFAALYEDGWRGITVLPERNESNTSAEEWALYKRSIDLVMSDGVYWEMKGPDAKNPTEKLWAIERAFNEAEAQFAGHPNATVGQTRVVLNGRYYRASDDAIAKKIERELKFRPNIIQVAQVLKNGKVIRHPIQ